MSVTVKPYNPAWATEFQEIKTRLESFLDGTPYKSIEHVGSTSVPGLAAKHVIDIDIIVLPSQLQPVIDALVTNGNMYNAGEMGIPDRHVVRDMIQDPPRHIYVCIEGAASLRNHLGIRDTLRQNAELRDEYGAVKLELAEQGINIIDYVEAKSKVIQKILLVAGVLTEEELKAVELASSVGEQFGALKTERLVLREFIGRDVQGYHELEGSEENARYQDWGPRTLEQARELVYANIKNSAEQPRKVWELVVEREGSMIGRVGAKAKTMEENHEVQDVSLVHLDLWFSFLPAVQGKGYATEAMTAFINELVKRQKGARVELEIECDPRNEGSCGLAKRLEFKQHSLTEKVWESKGEWVDSLVFRRTIIPENVVA